MQDLIQQLFNRFQQTPAGFARAQANQSRPAAPSQGQWWSAYANPSGKFDVHSLQRMFADATGDWSLASINGDSSQDGGLGATISPFSQRLAGSPSLNRVMSEALSRAKSGAGSGGGGGYGGGAAGGSGPMPGLPPYMQPPANWQQMLPGAMQMPPLYAQPGAQSFGIGNYRTPDYAGLLGRLVR